MSEPLVQSVKKAVEEHYASSERPLLLAQLGQTLRKQGIWPDPNNPSISLREFIERTGESSLHIVRDPKSSARIAIADEGHLPAVRDQMTTAQDSVAGQSIQSLNLSKIERSVLLAFCVKQDGLSSVYLRKSEPHSFMLTKPADSEINNYWAIDADHRIPGLRITNPQKLTGTKRSELASKIVGWCTANKVSISELTKKEASTGLTALRRLIESQTTEVRRQLLVPADIALLLSERE